MCLSHRRRHRARWRGTAPARRRMLFPSLVTRAHHPMNATTAAATLESPSFLEELRLQRWDDHRYYHQSRINQSLHLLSACTFLVSYALIPFHPAAAAILGWVVAMCIRQVGHFFFEPRGFDHVNEASFEHKEDIKLGYNLRR